MDALTAERADLPAQIRAVHAEGLPRALRAGPPGRAVPSAQRHGRSAQRNYSCRDLPRLRQDLARQAQREARAAQMERRLAGVGTEPANSGKRIDELTAAISTSEARRARAAQH